LKGKPDTTKITDLHWWTKRKND